MKLRITRGCVALALVLSATLRAEDNENSTAHVTAAAVVQALLEKAGAPALPIEVTMDRTTAILTGEVANRTTQELAAEVALSVEGVAKVDNRLRVSEAKPGAGAGEKAGTKTDQELADAKLETQVKLKLYGELGRRAARLEVEAVDGVVSVRGELPDAARKAIALETASAVKGVMKVVDLIKIPG